MNQESEMLTVELKVNGAPIGVMYIHNRGVTATNNKTLYHCEYHQYQSDKMEAFVMHTRDDGALKLLQAAVAEFSRKADEILKEKTAAPENQEARARKGERKPVAKKPVTKPVSIAKPDKAVAAKAKKARKG